MGSLNQLKTEEAHPLNHNPGAGESLTDFTNTNHPKPNSNNQRSHSQSHPTGQEPLEKYPTTPASASANQNQSTGIRIMGSDEDPKEYDKLRDVFRKLLIVGNVFGLCMIFLLLVWALKYGGGFDWNDKTGSINIHILIMVFFIIYLHGHAAIIYRIFPNSPKYGVKLIHGAIHLVVCVGIGVGLAAAVQSHVLKKSPHFYSLHSWLGITAISVYYLQFLGGFICFLLPMTPMSIRNLALPFHKFTGNCVFSVATGAAVTGVMLKAIGSLGTAYPELPAAAMVLNFAGFMALFFAIIIGVLMTDHRFRRRPRPEGELLLTKAGASAGGGGGGGDGDTSDHTD